MTFFNLFSVIICLFGIGLIGMILNRSNIILVLMSIELMLLSVNLGFIGVSILFDDIIGIIFSLFILTVAAAESSIGLALLIIYFRTRSTVSIDNFQILKN
jgi:NADH-quinone oxidoreductase subunit K